MAKPKEVRVLSVRQPWAWAIATGRKKVENRSWTTSYRGTVYIHASLRRDPAAVSWLEREMRLRVPKDLPTGAIVAVGTLKEVVGADGARRFGKWCAGPNGLVLTGVRRLRTPMPASGKLGLWRPSPQLVRAVECH